MEQEIGQEKGKQTSWIKLPYSLGDAPASKKELGQLLRSGT
ncbi:MAG: hypothetical protein AAF639_32480 [Chloroflexota bacterium]